MPSTCPTCPDVRSYSNTTRPSSTIFFLGEVFLFLICLNYAVRLSQTSLRIKNLAQEVTLLRAQIDRVEARREGV